MRGLILHFSSSLSLVPLKTASRGFMHVFFFSIGVAAVGVVVGGGLNETV